MLTACLVCMLLFLRLLLRGCGSLTTTLASSSLKPTSTKGPDIGVYTALHDWSEVACMQDMRGMWAAEVIKFLTT